MTAREIERSLEALEVHAEGLRRFANNIIEHVAVLKQELEGSGAPSGSARKGALPAKEKARVLARIQKSRIKKTAPSGAAKSKS